MILGCFFSNQRGSGVEVGSGRAMRRVHGNDSKAGKAVSSPSESWGLEESGIV